MELNKINFTREALYSGGFMDEFEFHWYFKKRILLDYFRLSSFNQNKECAL